MSKKKYYLFFLCFLVIVIDSFSQQNDIDILKNHLINDALKLGFRSRTDRYIISDFSKAGEYLQTMKSDGSWPDVNYKDRDNNWSPLKHLDRILVITINYTKETSSLHQNSALLQGLEKSLEYWYTVNPTCENWYKNVIAKQFYFNVIGLLLQGKIDHSLHSKIVNDLTEKPSMTGSNRTLVATSTIYRGVIENNAEIINLGVSGVTDQIIVTSKEGIQPDYSFHQHGPFIYNGSYGHNFLRESIWLATMVHGTGFAYSKDQIQTLRDYYLEGTRWMLRGGLIDYNVRGRQVGRPEGSLLSGRKIIPQLDQFIIADPKYLTEYQTSKKHIETHTPQDISGNKHFWRSDYTVHHRPAYFTSLKMCSERTVGIELNMNSENKLGYWLPYGLTYIYRRGNEYQGIFSAWDWARLPGVTSPHKEHVELKKNVKHTLNTSFVGGVNDGTYGVSAMDFSKDNTTAKKAWFWFDDEWVALGAGIRSTHAATIVTGINQCHLKGEVTVDGELFAKANQTMENPLWILHDSIGYVFPGNEPVEIKAEVQRGNMKRIYGLGADTVFSPMVFSIWFDHGTKPTDESYEYIVVPGINSADMAHYTQDLPVTILSNTAKVQAVSHNNLQITGIVFHKAGEFTINTDLTVAADKPSLLLLNHRKSFLTVSDPTAELHEIKITLKHSNGKPHTETIALPTGEFAGKSVKVKIKGIK